MVETLRFMLATYSNLNLTALFRNRHSLLVALLILYHLRILLEVFPCGFWYSLP